MAACADGCFLCWLLTLLSLLISFSPSGDLTDQRSFLHSSFLSSLFVVDLVYWRKVRKTGVVFTGLVIGLASMFQLSAITVISHICLGVMCVTFPLRLYYKLLELLRWNPRGEHPFQSHLDYDSSLTDKETVMLVEETVLLVAFAVTEIKRLLFIDSMIDSIKFVVLLYLLTYVGIIANGLTLLIAVSTCGLSGPQQFGSGLVW
eukprot:superscaffoldBa00000270_g3372